VEYVFMDVNLHLSVEIPAGIVLGALGIEIFPPWGRGWREKLPHGDFGAGIGEEASVRAVSPNPSIV
jgi:hypothetical protein